jgi:hypothetical protein
MRALGGLLYTLAAVSLLAALASVVVGPDWIERATGASPDNGDGSVEVVWIVAPLLAAAVLGAWGRRLRST